MTLLRVLLVWFTGGKVARRRLRLVLCARRWLRRSSYLVSGLQEIRYHYEHKDCHLDVWCIERWHRYGRDWQGNDDLRVAFGAMGLSDYELDGFTPDLTS